MKTRVSHWHYKFFSGIPSTLGNHLNKLIVQRLTCAHARPETATATTPFVRRVCVIDADDAAEIAESIEDFYNALVPLSMPLGCIGRQLKRLARDRAKHEATAEQLGCDMGEHRGARALDLLEKQAFLQPHKCKRVLSTIRQNKFGQAFAASHAFTCL